MQRMPKVGAGTDCEYGRHELRNEYLFAALSRHPRQRECGACPECSGENMNGYGYNQRQLHGINPVDVTNLDIQRV